MIKCDVCGKTTLLPEKINGVNICKICFMKTSGFSWKHQYDTKEDAEKQRCSALTKAYDNNFPQPVIMAINQFFAAQMKAMISCECCGQMVMTLQDFGTAKICKQCFGKINTSSWKQNEYDDNETVEVNRRKTLEIATMNNFTQDVICEINRHFDTKIQQGLLFTISSNMGQKLKIFDTYCILKTTDSFDVEAMSIAYAKAQKNSQPKEGFLSNGTVKSLARGVMTGGILMAGINLATSTAINAAADKYVPEKSGFKAVKGSYRINYADYKHVDYQPCRGEDIGFIRFKRSLSEENGRDEIVFFFKSNNKKYENGYNKICECISNEQHLKYVTSHEAPQKVEQVKPTFVGSVADEILKFKNLLDQGIITQEEFDRKKNELLG